MNTCCIITSEAITVPSLMMMTFIVSEESLEGSHTQTDTETDTETDFRLVYKSLKTKKTEKRRKESKKRIKSIQLHQTER